MRRHLASLVEDFRAHAADTAVVSHRGVRRYAATYGELAELAGRFAAELERREIVPGERVVLWGDNSAEWIAAFFGCLLRGVLVVPLDAAGSPEFARRVLDEVAPRLIVADPMLLGTLPPETPSLAFSGAFAHLPSRPDFRVHEAVQENAPFQIVFTSGTTAEPRGIVHTHRNVLASLRPIEAEMAKYRKYGRWVHPLRFLNTLPLSHVFGQFLGLWVPALLAAEVHFTDALEPARSIELIHRERISVLIAVPRVLEILRGHLLRHFPSLSADLDHAAELSIWKRWWRFRAVHRAFGLKFWAAISGGASLPMELERFWNRLGFALIQGYGMTETAALVTLNHPFRVGHGTIGKVLPGREVRLTETGEIMVRGDMVSTATWRGGRLQTREDQWLATGDLAEQTDSGDLRFVGRKGDAIVTSGGLNIYPSDIEAAMTHQPGIRGCVVVPCDLPSGAEPVSVVLFSGEEEALQTAARNANRGLAEYQHIRRILRWPEADFPYTSTGKLLRRKIKEWACAALHDQPDSSHRDSDPLLSLIAEITSEHSAICGDSLRLSEDLHLDSLGRVQLGSLIEQRMGLELEDAQLANMETLGDLRTLLDASERDTVRIATTGAQTSCFSSVIVSDAPSHPATTASPRSQGQSEPPNHVYPRWPWTWPVSALRIVFLEAVLRPLVLLLAAPRLNAPPETLPAGPLLIIANHVTAYDAALTLYALPGRLRRRVAIAMSGEMLLDFRRGRSQGSGLRNLFAPAAYWLLTAVFNVFPLPRLQGFRRSFAHAGEAMDSGYSVLIFPEGTRRRDGCMVQFRPGIGLLAEQSRVPVLPVALLGLDELRSGGRSWFRSGRLELHIGSVVTMPEQTSPAEWTEALETIMRKLLAETEGT